MIILEGPDHSGKSTLAAELSKALNMQVVHPGGAPKTLTEEFNFMVTQKHKSSELIIHDRVTCISQPVYSTMRHEGVNGDQYLPFIRQFESHPKVVIIYCRPPLKNMLEMTNHEVKAHETVEHVKMVEQNQRQLIAAYDALMANVMHINYDFTCMTYKQLIAHNRINNIFGDY